MTRFENMLLEKGYIKYTLNYKTKKYEVSTSHINSTIMNIDHRYFHKSDMAAISKINDGISVMDEKFTMDDRKGEICFGLHEVGKPATLIHPRPKINIKRLRNGVEVIENEMYDDSMNIILKDFTPEEILEAMYDESIVFEIDLTK